MKLKLRFIDKKEAPKVTTTSKASLGEMEECEVIKFGIGDILRSGLCRSYLIAKEQFGAQLNSLTFASCSVV